jgi:hypothetical protein
MLEGRPSDCHALANTVILMRLVEELALLSERNAEFRFARADGQQDHRPLSKLHAAASL